MQLLCCKTQKKVRVLYFQGESRLFAVIIFMALAGVEHLFPDAAVFDKILLKVVYVFSQTNIGLMD